MKFKKGDVVRLVRPAVIGPNNHYDDSTSNASNSWMPAMERSVGDIITLEMFDNYSGWIIPNLFTTWLEDWLEYAVENQASDPNAAYKRAMNIL